MNDQAEQAVENQNESAAKETENEDRAPFEDDVLLEEMVRALVTYPEDVEVKQTVDGERKELMSIVIPMMLERSSENMDV